MMKHSQKMVLVPERKFDSFERQQRQITPPTVTKLVDLDNEMRSVWEREGSSEEAKAKQYSEILERYLRFKDKRELEKREPITVALSPKEVNDSIIPEGAISKQSVSDIVEILPKTLRPKAKMILKRIGDNPDIVNWNERGELEYKGKVVPNTNIGDLVGDSLKKRKYDPEGYKIFTKALKQINIPQDLIRNPERLQLLRNQDNESPIKKIRSPSVELETSPGKKNKGKKNPEKKWLTNFT